MTRGFQAFILKVAPFLPLLVSALWLAGVASVWHSWLFCISPLQTFTTQNICPCQKCSSLNYWLFPQCFISWRGNSDAESAVTQHDWRYRCCSVPQLSVVCFKFVCFCVLYVQSCTLLWCKCMFMCVLCCHACVFAWVNVKRLCNSMIAEICLFIQTFFTELLKFQKTVFGWVLFCRNKILLHNVCTTSFNTRSL